MRSFTFQKSSYCTLLTIIALLSLARLTHGSCECGYTVGDERYTHAIITHFKQIQDVADISDGTGNELRDWEVSDWHTKLNGRPGDNDYRLPKRNNPKNVWIENGLLNLKQSAYSKHDRQKKATVSVAEIVTNREDIMYGSFRSRFKVAVEGGGKGGSVAGFFFYYDDLSETDIEILTKEDTNLVHYSQQPTYNYTTDESFEEASLTRNLAKPWTEFQEHRWDWLPAQSTFYQDNKAITNMTVNMPKDAGKIMLNLWADGGEWSGTPSSTDVIMQVEYVELYFNTSATVNGTDAEWNKACADAGGIRNQSATCIVELGDGQHYPDQSMATTNRASWSAAGLGVTVLWALVGMLGGWL